MHPTFALIIPGSQEIDFPASPCTPRGYPSNPYDFAPPNPYEFASEPAARTTAGSFTSIEIAETKIIIQCIFFCFFFFYTVTTSYEVGQSAKHSAKVAL